MAKIPVELVCEELDAMEHSGDSEQIAIAEHIRMVMSNGREFRTAKFLLIVADSLIESAKHFKGFIKSRQTRTMGVEKEEKHAEYDRA